MPQDFTDEFATIDLEDPPWSRRLSNVVAALLKSPGMSISAACGGWNETVVIYRLLNREDVSADALISPHHEATIQRFTMFPCIVVFQDTTDFDFSRMKEAEGLGSLNHATLRGFHMHSH